MRIATPRAHSGHIGVSCRNAVLRTRWRGALCVLSLEFMQQVNAGLAQSLRDKRALSATLLPETPEHQRKLVVVGGTTFGSIANRTRTVAHLGQRVQ